MIELLPTNRLAEILPLVAEVQALHAQAMPAHFRAGPGDDALVAMLHDRVAAGAEVLVWRGASGVEGYVLCCVDERAASAIRPGERFGKVDQLCVAPGARRRGIGSALVEAAKARLLAQGAARWYVTWWAFNEASARTMARCGAAPLHQTAGGTLHASK